MSFFVPGKRKFVKKYLPKEGALNRANVGMEIAEGMAPPKMPEIPDPPAAPTIDEAQKNRDQQDRLRRRRGVLANIYGGGSAATLGG